MSSPPSNSNYNKDKNNNIKSNYGYFDFLKYGETKFIILSLIITTVIRLFFLDEFKAFLEHFEGFDMTTQLIIPLLFGALGGYCYIIIDSVKSNYRQGIKHIKKKFSFVGSVAGVTAVNLLNPSGSVSQVMILALIAGLSGFSYLKRNALVDSRHEDSIMNELKADRKELTTEEVEITSSEEETPNEKLQKIYTEMAEMIIKNNEDKNKN